MKELIEFDVFDAGMNTKADPINLLPGQSDNMNNILFGDYGSIKTRGGISTYNSTPMIGGIASFPVIGLASYRPSTMSALLIAVCNSRLWVLTGASTTPTVADVGAFVNEGNVDTVQMNDLLFFVGPLIPARKFNGRELTQMGIGLPVVNATAVCDAGSGNLNGVYQYVRWGVNSYLAEGDYSTPSTAVSIGSGSARVNNLDTAPASYGVETWKIGRNTAGAQGIFWYLTDVTNGTTSFTDNIADADLDVLAPTDQGSRTLVFVAGCTYGGRFWGATGEYLWFSNEGQPEEFPSTNFIRVGQGGGLNICSLTPFMGMIVIGMSDYKPTVNATPYSQKTALYVLRVGDSVAFNDPENWYLTLIAENEGSESHRACIPVGGYLWMTGRKGVSLFNGTAVAAAIQDTASGGMLTPKISDSISTLFTLSEPSNIRLSCAIEWENKVYLSLDRNGNGMNDWPGNDTTLVYDYMRIGQSDVRKGAWSKFDSMGANMFAVHEGQLLGAGSKSTSMAAGFQSGGYLFRFDNGTNTDTVAGSGTTIAPTYRMTAIRGKKPHVYNDKDFRFVNLWASGIGTLTATFKINGVDYDSATQIHTEAITLTTAGAKTKIALPAVASGKHLWIQFSVAAAANNVDLTITKVQVQYNLRGLRNA
jgi:hypothetical protein